MKDRARAKDKTLSQRKKEDLIAKGDFVIGDFDNQFLLTFTVASEAKQGSLMGTGPRFYKNEKSLVLEVLNTPESFYSSGFCKLLLSSGEIGWLPNRWLKKI